LISGQDLCRGHCSLREQVGSPHHRCNFTPAGIRSDFSSGQMPPGRVSEQGSS